MSDVVASPDPADADINDPDDPRTPLFEIRAENP